MFTGIIEQQGLVISNDKKAEGHRLKIAAQFDELMIGESIAVNGVCLTLLIHDADDLHFDVSPESIACTNLKNLKPGERVNLERARSIHDRFGGHYVTGHVDTIATLLNRQQQGDFLAIEVGMFAPSYQNFLIPKGSITLDGVSLTINQVKDQIISIMLVPHTLQNTAFHQLAIGYQFNVEFDYLIRIVAHQLQTKVSKEVYS